jgi:hypothetical protein
MTPTAFNGKEGVAGSSPAEGFKATVITLASERSR